MTPDQLAADLDRTAERLADVIIDANRAAAGQVLEAARPPIDTGFLAASGEAVIDATGFAIVYTAPYAPVVHARDPFLTRALDEREAAVVDTYLDAVRTAIT